MTTETTLTAANSIVAEMSDDDRATFTVAGWFDGVSAMMVEAWDGLDVDDVLDDMADILA